MSYESIEAQTNFSVMIESYQKENTAPYFRLPVEESYFRIKSYNEGLLQENEEIEPILLGEIRDDEEDQVYSSLACISCQV